MNKGKVDAFDLVINVLKEHEKSLDNFLNGLESLLETLLTPHQAFRVLIRENRADNLKKLLEA